MTFYIKLLARFKQKSNIFGAFLFCIKLISDFLEYHKHSFNKNGLFSSDLLD